METCKYKNSPPIKDFGVTKCTKYNFEMYKCQLHELSIYYISFIYLDKTLNSNKF